MDQIKKQRLERERRLENTLKQDKEPSFLLEAESAPEPILKQKSPEKQPEKPPITETSIDS